MRKVFSSIMVASFVFATCAMNAMATDRKMTVTASPSADLEAGNTVTVEVKIDSDLNLVTAGYKLEFDEDIFSVDTASAGFGKPAKYIDNTWYTAIKNGDGAWGICFGTPTIHPATNYIGFSVAGSVSIPDEYDSTDYVIGKYTLTVKDGVEAKNATFSLSSDSYSGTLLDGATTTDSLTTVPCTVTFKQDEPEPDPKWDIAITEEAAAEGGHKVWKIEPTKTGTPADIDKFEITLKDAAENEITKKVKTEDLNTIMSSWNTGVVFHIGVQNVNGHQNITAAWDIAAGDAAIVPTVTPLN